MLPDHPTSSQPNGAQKEDGFISFASRRSPYTNYTAYPRKPAMNESHHDSQHIEYLSQPVALDESRLGTARMTGSPHVHCSNPVEYENSRYKWSGVRCNMKSSAAISMDQRSRKGSSSRSLPDKAELDIPYKQVSCPIFMEKFQGTSVLDHLVDCCLLALWRW